ncbi:MAG TPA: sigma-70 family RNA polymerase sigma factor [Clostridia bacterium]|jgi:RNA polymerase sigma factor (sigma-70 family)|nr:sigma-70 family RNA polymerase sigma factor [Clostridia bacterium]
MDQNEFVQRAQQENARLYRTALLYLGSEKRALDAVDEAVYKGLCACKTLREPAYFSTWLTRILINECKRALKRAWREQPFETLPETAEAAFDALPLKDAVLCLPAELKEVVILRYFSDFTLTQTAKLLNIPQGTAATRQRRALFLLKLALEEE